MAVLLVSSTCTAPAYAFGLGSVANRVMHHNQNSSGSLVNAQGKLVTDFTVAERELLTAQASLSKAFGLKRHAALLLSDAHAMHKGASQHDLAKAIGDSKRADEAYRSQMSKGKSLSNAGRQQYIKSIPPYAGGIVESLSLRPDLHQFLGQAKNTLHSVSPIVALRLKNKLKDGMYLARYAPSYISSLTKSTKEMVTYNKKQGITVPNNPLSDIPLS